MLQSISPGLVCTEFVGRLNKVDDMEESKKSFGNVGVSTVVHILYSCYSNAS